MAWIIVVSNNQGFSKGIWLS